MRKAIKWLDERLLKISVMFLIAFIPLYPKFPLFDLKHTWVYIRLDDIAIAVVTLIFGIQLLRRKATLRTPLTLPIAIYWIAGLTTTIFSLIFIVGHVPHIFSSLVVLHYMRRIEYMIVFFIAFNSVRSKKDLYHYVITLSLTVLAIAVYALGQRLAGFPAILTMNEEFAKGKLLYLPPTARLTATFAGHYDLAAYLVLVIPIIVSVMFAVRRWGLRILLFLLSLTGYIVLLFTESRISIAAYLFAISFVLFFLKKKILIIPVLIFSIVLMNFISGSSERFYKTFRIRKVAFNLETGQPIAAIEEIDEETGTAILESQELTEEELPVGTGFIGIPSTSTGTSIAPKKMTKKYVTEIRKLQYKTYATQELAATTEAKIATVSGKFLIGKALVYDLSFTTRFQGEWPRAMEAFKRNPILGSGFSTTSLATDNDYLRMIGESGILGIITFLGVFFTIAVFIYRARVRVRSDPEKDFALGVGAGIIGLSLNATLIDVFEASKVAYTLWIMTGLALGGLFIYYKRKLNLLKEITTFLTTTPMIIIQIIIISCIVFIPLLNNYFVGDDYTWLRWAAESGIEDLILFFIKADGFFYRPLQKLFYLAMFNIFWLIPHGYHMVSLTVHIGIGIGVFLLVTALFQKRLQALLSALIFIFLASNSESLFWISSLGNQLSVLFTIWTVYFYIYARKNSKLLLLIPSFFLSFFAMLSYEGGIVVPLIIFIWEILNKKRNLKLTLPFILQILAYTQLRNFAGAHGLAGDYNYNIYKFPANAIGNLAGYISMLLVGPRLSEPWFSTLRLIGKSNIPLFIVFSLLVIFAFIIFTIVAIKKSWLSNNFKFFAGYIFIALIPFLGLGNISIRYSYVAAPGFAMLIGYILYKIYNLLITKSKHAILFFVLLFTLIISYNIVRLKEASNDWTKAGEIAQNAIISLKLEFFPLYEEANFFFTNVPIRHGIAWVFPVGLEDAIWHTFRNPEIYAHTVNSVGEAYKLSPGLKKAYIFLFRNNKLERVSTETIEFEKEFIIEVEVEE